MNGRLGIKEEAMGKADSGCRWVVGDYSSYVSVLREGRSGLWSKMMCDTISV